MFSFKFIVVPEKNNALRLRITSNRKKAEISMGVSMEAKTLEKILKGDRNADALHASLIRQWQSQLDVVKVRLLLDNKRDIDVAELKCIVLATLLPQEAESKSDKTKADNANWEMFYEKYVESKKNASYRTSCSQTLDKMRRYCENFSELTFGDITLKWLRDLDEKMSEDGLSQNSRNIHFKNIRTCLNRAIDEELTSNYPFRRFKIRAEETRKRNLPAKELRRLFNYAVEPYQEYYLDYFKLMFFLIGINGTDLYNLTKIENGRVEYRRAKTHKLYSIKVEPEAMEIIDRHRSQNGNGLLDITDRWKKPNDFLKNMNIALKKIGKLRRVGRGGKKEIKPEWPEMSSYWTRHSWATIAADLDIPDAVVSLALGHAGPNTTTNIYIHRNQKKVDRANRIVLDWVLYGKEAQW